MLTKQQKGGASRALYFSKLRKLYQEEGREVASKNDPLFLMGCMLYWAEGSKKVNTLEFTNCDPEMLILFIDFYNKFFAQYKENITLYVNCYLDENLTEEDVKTYWCDKLQVKQECFKKVTNRNRYYKNTSLNVKFKYGIVKIQINSVRVLQNIYGGINFFLKKDIFPV